MPQAELDWSDPVKRPFRGGEWAAWCIRHYEQLLIITQTAREDPLGKRHFASACVMLDREPQPETPEQANELWRQFVGAVWLLMKRYQEREARAQQVQRRRTHP